MKKAAVTIFGLAFLFLVLESLVPLKVLKREGTEPGYTGSPGDTLKNCTVCHGGTATKVNGWITSNVPAEGYMPGQTYIIKVKNKEVTATRFGFQVSPQNLKGDLMGKLEIKDWVKTQLVGPSKYVTYTSNGVDGKDSLNWDFYWIAPATGSGNVVFYGGFNSNFDGHKDGDRTYLSTLTVKESPRSAILSTDKNISDISIFNNSLKNLFEINFTLKNQSDVLIEALDIQGKRVALVANGKRFGQVNSKFSTEDFVDGIYFISVKTNMGRFAQKVLVTH